MQNPLAKLCALNPWYMPTHPPGPHALPSLLFLLSLPLPGPSSGKWVPSQMVLSELPSSFTASGTAWTTVYSGEVCRCLTTHPDRTLSFKLREGNWNLCLRNGGIEIKINTVPQVQGPESSERETICIWRTWMILWKDVDLSDGYGENTSVHTFFSASPSVQMETQWCQSLTWTRPGFSPFADSHVEISTRSRF